MPLAPPITSFSQLPAPLHAVPGTRMRLRAPTARMLRIAALAASSQSGCLDVVRFVHQAEENAVLIGKFDGKPCPEIPEGGIRRRRRADLGLVVIAEIMRVEQNRHVVLADQADRIFDPLELILVEPSAERRLQPLQRKGSRMMVMPFLAK